MRTGMLVSPVIISTPPCKFQSLDIKTELSIGIILQPSESGCGIGTSTISASYMYMYMYIQTILHWYSVRTLTFKPITCTVKPLLKGQPRGITKLAFVDRWPLFGASETT